MAVTNLDFLPLWNGWAPHRLEQVFHQDSAWRWVSRSWIPFCCCSCFDVLCVHTPEVCKREAPWAACLVDSRDKEYDIFSSFLLSERTINFFSDGRKAETWELLVAEGTAQLVYSPAPGWSGGVCPSPSLLYWFCLIHVCQVIWALSNHTFNTHIYR